MRGVRRAVPTEWAFQLERVPPPLLAAGYARLPDVTAALGVAHSTVSRAAKGGAYGVVEKIGGCHFARISKVLASERARGESEMKLAGLVELARRTREEAIKTGLVPVEGEFELCTSRKATPPRA